MKHSARLCTRSTYLRPQIRALQTIATQQNPVGYWRSTVNQLREIDKAEATLGITEARDWYSVAITDLQEIGWPSRITKTQIAELLALKYLNHDWDKVFLLRGKYAQQKRLERAVKTLFPGFEVRSNVRKEVQLTNPLSGDYLEIDVFLPSINLAFEYQEIHHYRSSDYAYSPLQEFQDRDRLKKSLAMEKGITLIIVPCWWDGHVQSLAATIKNVRPDVKLDVSESGAVPIPEHMPRAFIERHYKTEIEGIGSPMTACFFTGTNVDPTNWWIFEKYDGVRGFWNPHKKTLFSRYGREFRVPQDVIDSMPRDMYLDGELWFGRSAFQEAAKLANRTEPELIAWDNFKYMVFDVPNCTEPFKDRYAILMNRFGGAQHPYVRVAPKEVCTNTEHVEKFFQDIIDQGGEGIILRDPQGQYHEGRSRGYLKHKKFRDTEARIIASLSNGLWECEMPNGVTFTAAPGTTEFIKRQTPKVGDIVTFKYKGFFFGSKKPKSPSLHRLREDMAWEDVVKNFKEKKPLITESPTKLAATKKKAKGFWLSSENRRQFFCKLAGEKGFDPNDNSAWARITKEDIITREGGRSILQHYPSFRKAIKAALPSITFVSDNGKRPNGYWRDPLNCKQFFDELAKELGFSPSNAALWAAISYAQVTAKEGGRSVINAHKGIKKALQVAYGDQFSL